ncbi:DUF3459 domain-containing protein [Arsenicitalea aurantiaca]|uniref:DUF3459 domain-containing protein n=1 Tax=Arsenicitalea aurantiaca TaxID=1783274 RepID=A0A433XBN8_9HYPH|nr:alpha-glucosidase family protein [Arsenicitalea aurantiaca]RUT31454.1 DUF3459 domain-containing protein [Arsenicitalea aurantiaca]
MPNPTGSSVPTTRSDWWRGAVIYQIYPRSFMDANGDGVGDLAGITRRLDHIAGLGVDAIWLSPVFTSPMRDFGYDVANYRDIDPIFGTLADFDRMLEKAHALGLRVIIDQVISHSSDRHPWFQESRLSRTNQRADWYVWADPNPDGTPPNNWLSVFGGSAWTWDARRMQYYLHNFLASQPDLNFHNPAVQEAVLDAMRFWLERGVDGFRLDTTNYYFHSQGLEANPVVKPEEFNASMAPAVNPYNFQEHLYDKSRPETLGFLKRIRALVDEYPGRATVGEISDSQHQLRLMAEYTTGTDRLNMAYTFDYLGGDFDASHFAGAIARTEAEAPGGWVCLAFSNHDVVRHVSRWARPEDREAFGRLSLLLLLCMRGSVCLYQGEELGLPEAEIAFEDLTDPYGIEFWPEFKGRDGCRTPMVWEADAPSGGFTSAARPWLPVPQEHLARAVDRQANDPHSMLNFYREALAFRKTHPALIGGTITLLERPEGVLAFTREAEGERLVCVFNMRAEPASFENAALDGSVSCGAPGTQDAPDGMMLKLAPFGAYIAAMA